MSAIPECPTSWQAGFLNVLPAVQTHAQIQFRKLPAQIREDAIQEAIAVACVNYQVLAARGQLHVAYPGTLADFAVRHVRNGRHVGGHQDAAKDVLSPVAHQRHGVRVLSCDIRRPERNGNDWKRFVIADRKHPIADTVAFRLDFGHWLTTLGRRDRKIIRAMVGGEGTSAVADRFGLSAARVSQLRRRYEQAWLVFQGEAA